MKPATLFFLFITLVFSSCKKDETKVMMNNNRPKLSSTISAPLVLRQANADQPALTLNYDNVELGFADALGYTLQIAPAGHDFKSDSLIEIDLDRKAGSRSFTVRELNTLLLNEFLPAEQTINYEFRIRTSSGKIYSNILPLTITTYQAVGWIYVPGAYQGWDPATADSLISASGNGIYIGTILFPPDNYLFKITPAKTWDVAYGDGGNGKLSTAGVNIAAPAAGSYQIRADLNVDTFKIVYHQWSVIGDATSGGWNADTDMKFNNGDSSWSVITTLTGGKAIKFRYNHDWAGSYGGSKGVLNQSNDNNIPVATSGIYHIKFDLPNMRYTLTRE